MMKKLFTAISAAMLIALPQNSGAASSRLFRVDTLNDTSVQSANGQYQNTVKTADLISLQDIGGLYDGAMAVSPNGKQIALQIQKSSPELNDYILKWYVVNADTALGERATEVGHGGDVILIGENTGAVGGIRINSKAQWSPDSEWIAYTAKNDGEVQLWRSHKSGNNREQLSFNDSDVRNFFWSADATKIFFTVEKSRKERKAALEQEGKNGFLFDDRFIVYRSQRPLFDDPNARSSIYEERESAGLWVIDLDARQERRAIEDELQEYRSLTTAGPSSIGLIDRAYKHLGQSPRGDIYFWFENEDPKTYRGYAPPFRLIARGVDGPELRCKAPECFGLLVNAFWSEDTREVIFTKMQGVNGLERGVYAWTPGTESVRTVLTTDDQLHDCQMGEEQILCLHEGAVSPRKIVSIDTHTGEHNVVFDPNPQFSKKVLPRVEKWEWQEDSGAFAAGHLVYPIGYEEGQTYPLVIVQYRSRGFLRGGTGDEYPILPLSAAGYFVLSFDRPERPDLAARLPAYEVERANWSDNFWEKSSALSALEIAIEEFVDRGLVDKDRVGITGLSDGSETLWYSLIYSDIFSAAITVDGGWSPSSYFLVNSQIRERYFRYAAGFSPPLLGGDDRWRRIATEANIDRINAPVLLHVSDRELVPSAPGIGALMDAGRPIEAYVYPNEYHTKWQPVHKLSVYNRTIDWFNFWLRDVEDRDPEKAEQYARWRELRKLHEANLAGKNSAPVTADR